MVADIAVVVITILAIIVVALWINDTNKQLKETIKQFGEQMSIDFSKLETSIQAEANAETAVVNLLATLTAEIKNISAGSSDPATQAKLDQLAADTDARTAALSAAVTANTPAAKP